MKAHQAQNASDHATLIAAPDRTDADRQLTSARDPITIPGLRLAAA